MKYLITERQLKILEQGGLGIYGAPGTKSQEQGMKAIGNLDPHTLLEVLGIGTAFIPYIGPLISAGIALADADLYYKQGDTKTAGLVASLALLPGIGPVVSKIPAIRQLGSKGMSVLARKIAKGTKIVDKNEISVVSGIKNNLNLVKTNLKNKFNELSKKIPTKGAQNLSGVIKKGVQDLFKENPRLSKIGTPEQYSRYLDTVFPNSEAKDIVYHGTNETFDKFEGYFTSFIDNKKFAQEWAKNRTAFRGTGEPKVYAAKVNIDSNKLTGGSISKYDNDGPITGHEYKVVGDENILKLGSEKDLEGFKNFVLNNK